MKKRMIKILAVVLISLVFIISGCVFRQARIKGPPKTFFGRTISYTVDSEAREYMNRLEGLLSLVYQKDTPLPDELVLPLYKDADSFINRDHRITLEEANGFYDEYVMKFEDSLEPLRSNRAKSEE